MRRLSIVLIALVMSWLTSSPTKAAPEPGCTTFMKSDHFFAFSVDGFQHVREDLYHVRDGNLIILDSRLFDASPVKKAMEDYAIACITGSVRIQALPSIISLTEKHPRPVLLPDPATWEGVRDLVVQGRLIVLYDQFILDPHFQQAVADRIESAIVQPSSQNLVHQPVH